MMSIRPKPPSHWEIWRQRRRLRGRDSGEGMTEEPVVVNPDTLSKIASAGDKERGGNMKGTAPAKGTRIQAKAVVQKLSRPSNSLSWR